MDKFLFRPFFPKTYRTTVNRKAKSNKVSRERELYFSCFFIVILSGKLTSKYHLRKKMAESRPHCFLDR